MAVFAYRAWDINGRRTRGTITANSDAEGRGALRDRGLRVERIAPASARSPARLRWPTIMGAARRDERVAELARTLALLLRGGVTLSESLDTLIAETKGRLQSVLRGVRESLEAGQPLAESLRRHPRWFSDIFVEAVRVGEQAGTLDTALTRLAEYLRDRQSLAARLKTAAVYPLILMTVAVGVVLFLMTKVIPQLLTVLSASGQTLPASTQILKTVSDLILIRWPILLASVIVICTATTTLLRTARGRRAWHGLLLRLPLLSPLLRKALVARFAQQMSMMLATGVPFLTAVGVVKRTAGNLLLSEELGDVERAVEAGGDIAPALAVSRVFPPLVARLIAVGERAGELPDVLDQLREGYETEVRVAVTRFTAALEPLLIVFMAAVVGFIVLATLMPILQVTRSML